MGVLGGHLGAYLGQYLGIVSAGVPPAVSLVGPPLGRIASTDEITIDIADGVSIAYVAAFASFSGGDKAVVFRRGAFEPGFALWSFIEQVAEGQYGYLGQYLGSHLGTYLRGAPPLGVRYRLHIRRDRSWPIGGLAITVDAVNGTGNLSSTGMSTFAWTTAPPALVAVPHDAIPMIDPVALALARLPHQYRGDDDEPTELLT